MHTEAKFQELKKQVGNHNYMNLNYPVGDFLIRLKNAAMAERSVVSANKSKLNKAVAEALKKEGFLDEVKEEKDGLTVKLSFRKKEPVLLDVKLVSKPGLRIYMNVEELVAKKGPSVVILSTPLGVLSAKDAIKKKVGGEVIAEIF